LGKYRENELVDGGGEGETYDRLDTMDGFY